MTDKPHDYGEPWSIDEDVLEDRHAQTVAVDAFNRRQLARACECVNALATVPDPAGLMREVRIVIEDLIRVIATTPDPPGMGDVEALAVYKARTLLASLPPETET